MPGCANNFDVKASRNVARAANLYKSSRSEKCSHIVDKTLRLGWRVSSKVITYRLLCCSVIWRPLIGASPNYTLAKFNLQTNASKPILSYMIFHESFEKCQNGGMLHACQVFRMLCLTTVMELKSSLFFSVDLRFWFAQPARLRYAQIIQCGVHIWEKMR